MEPHDCRRLCGHVRNDPLCSSQMQVPYLDCSTKHQMCYAVIAAMVGDGSPDRSWIGKSDPNLQRERECADRYCPHSLAIACLYAAESSS